MQPNFTNKKEPPQTLNHVTMEGAGLLVGLGLTSRQAWVYLALLRLGDSRGRLVASLAGVPRQEVYGLLLELQKLGLVQKRLTFPVSFTAVPFPEAVKMLFEAKTSEFAIISQKVERVTEKFTQNPPPVFLPEPPKPCFGVVCQGERGKKYSVAIEGVQCSFELVCGWVRFRQLCFRFEVELRAALHRGVVVRVITEKPPKHRLPKWVANAGEGFGLRTVPDLPDVALAVFDGVEVAVAFDAAARLTKGPELWTRHGGLVAVCRGYFEAKWAALK